MLQSIKSHLEKIEDHNFIGWSRQNNKNMKGFHYSSPMQKKYLHVHVLDQIVMKLLRVLQEQEDYPTLI